MKNYVASTTINFEGSKFYVRPGDTLSHNPANNNSLAVYRGGELVKVLKAEPLVIDAFVRSKFIQEYLPEKEAPVEVKAIKPVPGVKPKEDDVEYRFNKRKKAVPEEVPIPEALLQVKPSKPSSDMPSQVVGPDKPKEKPQEPSYSMSADN